MRQRVRSNQRRFFSSSPDTIECGGSRRTNVASSVELVRVASALSVAINGIGLSAAVAADKAAIAAIFFAAAAVGGLTTTSVLDTGALTST